MYSERKKNTVPGPLYLAQLPQRLFWDRSPISIWVIAYPCCKV